MSEVVQEFIDAMNAAGIGPSDPSEIIADDEIHRYALQGDRPHVKNGSYKLAENDGFGFGWFQSFKMGEVINWHSKTRRRWSPEEKAAHKRRAEEAKRKRDEARKSAAQASRAEAVAIWNSASRTGHSPYLERKGVDLRGVRYDGETLIVPMWRDGEIASVQRILPDGAKLFLKASDHVGAYFSIRGEPDTIAICEGVANGAWVAKATGWSVICAFNAGNLKPVAKSVRKKYPDARIVFAADNDHETVNGKGEPWNVGKEKAQQAAVAIGGAQVIVPECEEGESDWDDVAHRLGLGAVRDALTSVPAPVEPDYPEEEDDQWLPDFDGDEVVVDDPMDAIRPLGFDKGRYYFFPRATGQIMDFSATDLGRQQNLFQLAPLRFWLETYAPEESMSKIAGMASAELIDACHRRGIYKIGDARGVGVWRDKGGSLLVNCGDVIVGEGVRCHPSEFKGDYVYEAGKRVINMDVEPLDAHSASKFRDICRTLTWRRKQSGDLMAGWCVIAAAGGCLSWRPHIFITGRKGSGKSTAMEKIVMGALDRIAIKRDGGTTEAGIRKAIGLSSSPFIMDEAEAESGARRAQMKAILEYFRNASSGAVVENAYDTYVARSAACFGAINPFIEQGADADRWSILELVPNTGKDRDAHYKQLLRDISETITRDFPDRLLARTVANLDVLLDNISVFVDVFSEKLGSKRAGDQIGTLIAGSYSLTSSKRVTHEFVEEWVARQDWDWQELQGGADDADTLLTYIMSSRVRYDHNERQYESNIGEMVWRAVHHDAIGHDAALKGLASVGVKIEDGRLIVSNSAPRMRDILKDTPWCANWHRALSDYTGADNCEGRVVYFTTGLRSRATSIPLDLAMGMEDVDAGSDDGWEIET